MRYKGTLVVVVPFEGAQADDTDDLECRASEWLRSKGLDTSSLPNSYLDLQDAEVMPRDGEVTVRATVSLRYSTPVEDIEDSEDFEDNLTSEGCLEPVLDELGLCSTDYSMADTEALSVNIDWYEDEDTPDPFQVAAAPAPPEQSPALPLLCVLSECDLRTLHDGGEVSWHDGQVKMRAGFYDSPMPGGSGHLSGVILDEADKVIAA